MTNATGPRLTLSATEQLLAIEEIKRLFAARLRCMDNKEWDSYASFHTADVISDSWNSTAAAQPARFAGTQPSAPVSGQPGSKVGGQVTGGQALADAIRNTLDGKIAVTSVHHGHTPEIELTSDTTARGVWAMEDKLWWTDPDTGEEEHLHGYGHYHEEYRLVEGWWLISYRNLTRLRVDATPGFHNR